MRPNRKIIFRGRDASTGAESTNPIDINPLGNGAIDMNFNGTNNIKGVNTMEAAFYGDINATDISANDISANKIYVDNLESRTSTKIIIGDDLDLSQKDIIDVLELSVDRISQNGTSSQIIIGNIISPSFKYVKFGNKIALYTTTRANALLELNNSISNNYLIGYTQNNSGSNAIGIKGGLIYRAQDVLTNPSGNQYMNKLITTTSTGYFSTNYFRTLPLNNNIYLAGRQQNIFFSPNNPTTYPFYRVGFNYTNSLILSPGIYAWHPGTPSYTYPKDGNVSGFGTGVTGTNNSGRVLGLKNMQLPKDQYIRVLSFTFEGYNTTYSLNTVGLGLPTGAKTNFEIVFGFGNNRVFQTGPWSTLAVAENNFIICKKVTTATITVGQPGGSVLDLPDLSLNTYFNSNTNPLTNDHKPNENKAIKTSFESNNATSGTLTGTSFTPYDFSGAVETLSLIVDGTTKSILLDFNCDSSFNFISQLNTKLSSSPGATASEFNGFLRITSDTTGTSSSVELTTTLSGTNARKLLYDPTTQPVPAGLNGTNSFIYNDLQPYIFIRAMDASNNVPWTRDRLTAAGAGASGFRSWTLTNRTRTEYGETVPISDLPWTCPFGAQFQFEHYIPAPGGE